MHLGKDHKRRALIEALMTDHYGPRLTPARLQALMAHFAGEDSLIVEDAVCRHLENTTISNGGPVGAWPPTVADLTAQIQAARRARHDQQQEEVNRQRAAESDAPYTRAMASTTWQREIAQGAAIRNALIARHHLDPKAPGDMKLIMRTLKAVTGAQGLGTVEQACDVSDRLQPFAR